MPKIDKVSWGKITVDGRGYHQVLIIGDEVLERKSDKLHHLFGTTHQIADWEKNKLISRHPEIVLIGSGWSGLVKIEQEFEDKLKKEGVELRTVLTPRIVKEYNRLVGEGKRVNALVHTTC